VLLNFGASLTLPDENGETAINLVAKNGTFAIFGLCVASLGYLLPTNRHGETLLHAAAAGGQIEIVKELIESGEDVKAVSCTGWSALLFAIAPVKSSMSLIELLLSHGAGVEDSSAEGWTVLHRITFLEDTSGEATELVEKFISLGADVEAKAEAPMVRKRLNSWSSLYGHSLRQALADQYDEDPTGIVKQLTPLHWAAESGSVGVLKALLKHGANPSARDSQGATPAIRATTSSYYVYGKHGVSRRQEVVKLLVEAGADVGAEDNIGNSVQLWARGQALSPDPHEW